MPRRREEILSVFFDAMQEGYARSPGPEKGTIAELPGSKTIWFESGDFKLLDYYLVTPDTPCSFGQTIIWHENVPVWTMAYQGRYRKTEIPFLKRALRSAYERRQFFGGRGPRLFRGDGLMYFNYVELQNNWNHFRGHEEVFSEDGDILGWHDYQGMLLV